MLSRTQAGLALATLWLLAGGSAANTIHVTILADEDNANTAGTNPSTGCSLREALKSAFDGVDRSDCDAPTPGGPNTIVFDLSGTIIVNGLVPRPGGGMPAQVRNGIMPDIHNQVIVDGSGRNVVLSCDAAPNGQRIFHEAVSAAKLTLTALTVANCTTGGFGLGVMNDGGDLTLNTVTFDNLHNNDGGLGAAVYHNGGSLNANNVTFKNNIAQNDASPNDGSGNGAALAIVSAPLVNLTNVVFDNNKAGGSGGAIHIVDGIVAYSITINNGTFTRNVANGNATDAGGGAIWAQLGSDAVNVFQITGSLFGGPSSLLGNSAPRGVGGAIALSGGRLAFVDPTVPLGGGVVASHFQSNSAGGDADSNGKGGSGGAIYVNGGILSVVQSSFIGNSSTHGTGGGIYFNNIDGGNATKLWVVNSTFNGNSADQAGGALINRDTNGAVDIRNSTIAGNSSADNTAAGNAIVGGGGFYNANGYNGGPNFARSFVANTLIASNTAANCAGQPFVARGPNLQFGDSSCVDSGAPALIAGAAAPQAAATVPSGDPKLGAAAPAGVAANGVPALNALVFVMKPDSNHSAALDAGDNGICSSGPVLNFDATGVPTLRPYGDANCDLGAYEQSVTTPVQLQSFEVD